MTIKPTKEERLMKWHDKVSDGIETVSCSVRHNGVVTENLVLGCMPAERLIGDANIARAAKRNIGCTLGGGQ